MGGVKRNELALQSKVTNDHLKGAIDTLANVIRTIHLKRALTRVAPDPHLNFWRVVYGNLLDMAVIEWCKLFGSDNEDHQQLHWKNVFQDARAFRSGLYRHLGIDGKTFLTYWKLMKAYRDKHAAHLDFDKPRISHYPTFDYAIASSYYYYMQLIPGMRKRGIMRYPDDLKTYGEAFFVQAGDIAARAILATKNVDESLG
jgi:hypothetical protein